MNVDVTLTYCDGCGVCGDLDKAPYFSELYIVDDVDYHLCISCRTKIINHKLSKYKIIKRMSCKKCKGIGTYQDERAYTTSCLCGINGLGI